MVKEMDRHRVGQGGALRGTGVGQAGALRGTGVGQGGL